MKEHAPEATCEERNARSAEVRAELRRAGPVRLPRPLSHPERPRPRATVQAEPAAETKRADLIAALERGLPH